MIRHSRHASLCFGGGRDRDKVRHLARVDLYTVLEVSRTADTTAIRDAYRRLAKLYHPDVSDYPDAHQRFIRITEAYEVLGDPERRRHYDLSGPGRHGRSASAGERTRHEQEVHRYQREARERAERFSRMKYEQFDVEYFDSVFAYVAPKMLGCFGIMVAVLLGMGLLVAILIALPITDQVRIPVMLLLLFGALPLIAWLSTRFDASHNARQKRRKNRG